MKNDKCHLQESFWSHGTEPACSEPVFLTNELWVTSCEIRVTIYCTSYELLFIFELRVTI